MALNIQLMLDVNYTSWADFKVTCKTFHNGHIKYKRLKNRLISSSFLSKCLSTKESKAVIIDYGTELVLQIFQLERPKGKVQQTHYSYILPFTFILWCVSLCWSIKPFKHTENWILVRKDKRWAHHPEVYALCVC